MAKYRLVKEVQAVRVKVPSRSAYMSPVNAHTFESEDGPVTLPDHWKNGMIVGDKVDSNNKLVMSADGRKPKQLILSRLFFGISESDLGRTIVATVKVEDKTTEDGQVYTLFTGYKTTGVRPAFEVKYQDNPSDVPVLSSRKFIHFLPLEEAQPTK